MDVRNRMSDVVQLRCHVCQAFLKMIIQPGWQGYLYDIAKDAVDNRKSYRNQYIAMYEEMRDTGVDDYTIDKMDVTLIATIASNCKKIAPMTNTTREALLMLRDDRNLTNHASENEDDDELYLRGLLALCNLRNFVRAVDKYETDISDEERLNFRRKYIEEIEALKSLLDEERISLIHRTKEMDKDIKKVIDDDYSLKTWCNVNKLYLDRSAKVDKNMEIHNEFIVRASDAGIKYAHVGAASYYVLIKKNYEEMERRLFMLLQAYQPLPPYEAKSIIDTINSCLMSGGNITEGMNRLVDEVKKAGYNVSTTVDGMFQWSNTK